MLALFAFGLLLVPNFCGRLDRLWGELGLQIVISEYAYPGEKPRGGMFGNWTNHLHGYPRTHGGHPQWLAGFLASLQFRPNILGAYYSSPALHWSGELWVPFVLFDVDRRDRPGIGAFTTP